MAEQDAGELRYYEVKLHDTTIEMLVERLAEWLFWEFHGTYRVTSGSKANMALSGLIPTVPDFLFVRQIAPASPNAGDIVASLTLTHYVKSAVHLEMTLVKVDPFPEHLKKWVKRYYTAELVETDATPEDAKRLTALANEANRTGPKYDGANVWLEYALTTMNKKPGSKPEGNEVFEIWRTLLDFEKPDDQLKEDDDRVVERYRKAVERVRKRSEQFGTIE